jgi:hypothetical protein
MRKFITARGMTIVGIVVIVLLFAAIAKWVSYIKAVGL